MELSGTESAAAGRNHCMLPHDRDAYRHQMGHLWLGFSEAQIRDLFDAAGFRAVRVHALPPDPRAKGPALFVAVARRPAL